MIFDTGSGNLWVTSSNCKAYACKIHPSFDNKKSTKYRKLGGGVEVTFGSGTIIGEINQDQFKLGNLIIPEQKFGEIFDEIGEVFVSGRFSGILGMSYPEMAAFGITPVFDNLMKSKLLKENMFTFFYSWNENVDGQITFGYIDDTKYKGDIKYYPVVEKFYWTIELDDIKYDGKSLGLCPNKCKAIIDTGTTLIAGPTKDINSLLQAVSVENDCKNFEINSKLTFVFGGDEYDLNTDEYILKNDYIDSSACSALFMKMDLPNRYKIFNYIF